MRMADWFLGRIKGFKKLSMSRIFYVYGFHLFTMLIVFFCFCLTPWYFWSIWAVIASTIIFLGIFPFAWLFNDVKLVEEREKREKEAEDEFFKDQNKVVSDLAEWMLNDISWKIEARAYMTPAAIGKLADKLIAGIKSKFGGR